MELSFSSHVPCVETISTLRFGQRAKKIKNNAVINVQYSAEELQKQVSRWIQDWA